MTVDNTTPITILLAEPDEYIRAQIRTQLARDGRFSIVGEVAGTAVDGASDLDRDAVLSAAEALQPDVVVVEPRSGNGIDFALLIGFRRVAENSRILVVSDITEIQTVWTATTLRINGYFFKADEFGIIFNDAVFVIGRLGVKAIDVRIVEALADLERNPPASREIRGPAERLTAYEREVVRLLCEKNAPTTKQLAARYGLSVGTIRKHIRAIKHKLGARTTIMFGYLVALYGLVDVSDDGYTNAVVRSSNGNGPAEPF